MCVCVNKQFLCKMLTCPHWSLRTYHGAHVSQCPSGQSGGPRRGAHTVGVSYANAWPCHNGRRDATRCWFDSLLWRLNQGLLTVQQRQPQGWEAFLLTSKKKRIKKAPEFTVKAHNKHAWENTKHSCGRNSAVFTGCKQQKRKRHTWPFLFIQFLQFQTFRPFTPTESSAQLQIRCRQNKQEPHLEEGHQVRLWRRLQLSLQSAGELLRFNFSILFGEVWRTETQFGDLYWDKDESPKVEHVVRDPGSTRTGPREKNSLRHRTFRMSCMLPSRGWKY